jgi:sugar-phosphatase
MKGTNIKKVISCKAILFDLDGVLIDSTSCIERHWQEWAQKHDIDLVKILQNAHGVRTIETMKIVAPHLDIEKEAAQFTANEILDTEGVVAIPGAKTLIDQIPTNQWTIVTSGSYDLVQARLKKSRLPMPKAIVTADSVSQGKPSPEPYLVGAKNLDISINECCVIEDAPIGVRAGKNAGAMVVGVLSTHSREELLGAGVDYLIDNLGQIKIIFDKEYPLITIHLS